METWTELGNVGVSRLAAILMGSPAACALDSAATVNVYCPGPGPAATPFTWLKSALHGGDATQSTVPSLLMAFPNWNVSPATGAAPEVA
jgi:hypothetical protein